MTPGQAAYEEDCARRPTYPDGAVRRTWCQLSDVVRWSWERQPTPREYEDRPRVAGCR